MSGEHQMGKLVGFGICLAVAVVLFVALTLSDPKYWMKLIVQIEKKLGAYVDFIWSLMFLSLPIFVVYLTISFLNQRIRRIRFLIWQMFCGGATSSQNESEDAPAESVEATSVMSSSMFSKKSNGWFTKITSTQIRELETLECSKLLEWTIYWGMAIVACLFVVAYTNVILSWVIGITEKSHPGLVGLYVIITGLVMFVNPAVPGTPIYAFAGLMFIPSYEKSGGSRIAGLFISFIIGLITKLLACTMQQKAIGQSFSHFVKIRQMVDINSDLMRGTKLILSDSKLTVAKVSILCGGPDWPTSVLCGILGLNLLSILVGTLPVICIVVPAVLSGYFPILQRGVSDEEKRKYQRFFVLFGILAGLFQLIFLRKAVSCIETTLKERAEEIRAIPIDEDVKNADDKEEETKEILLEVSRWHSLPLWVKSAKLFSVLNIEASFYTLFLFTNESFVDFAQNDSIEEKLDADVLSLVKPLGWISLFMFGLSSFSCIIFKFWAKKEAAKVLLNIYDSEEQSLVQSNHSV